MITHICDRCGRPIFKGELRYTARIEVFAAPDSGEITIADLLTDQTSEIDRLLAGFSWKPFVKHECFGWYHDGTSGIALPLDGSRLPAFKVIAQP